MNYRWQNGKKIGTLSSDQLQIVFVTNCTGFTADLLRFNEHLYFYGHMSVATYAYAIDEEDKLSDTRNLTEFHKQYQHARFYYLVVEQMGITDVEIENEISAEKLQAYDAHVHANVFPPLNPD